MKEVYSIWIVMDMDVKKEEMIEVHTFPEKEDKTLMNIIMVYPLKEDSENESHQIFYTFLFCIRYGTS